MQESAPSVSAIVTVDDDSLRTLDWAIRSLKRQSVTPDELLVADATSGTVWPEQMWDGDCQNINCNGWVEDGGERVALSYASGDYAVLLGSDTVLVDTDHIETSISEMGREDVSAVASPSLPMEDGVAGEVKSLAERAAPMLARDGALVIDPSDFDVDSNRTVREMARRGSGLTVNQAVVTLRSEQAESSDDGAGNLLGIVAAAALGGIGSAIGTAAINYFRKDVL